MISHSRFLRQELPTNLKPWERRLKSAAAYEAEQEIDSKVKEEINAAKEELAEKKKKADDEIDEMMKVLDAVS